MTKINLWSYDLIIDGQVMSIYALSDNDMFCLRVVFGGKIFERRCFGSNDSESSVVLSKSKILTGRLMGPGGELELRLNVAAVNVMRSGGGIIPSAVKLGYMASVRAEGSMLIGGRKREVVADGIAILASGIKMPDTFAVMSAVGNGAVLGAVFADNAILRLGFRSHFSAGEAGGRSIRFGSLFSKADYYDTGSAIGVTVSKGIMAASFFAPVSSENTWEAAGVRLRTANSVNCKLNVTRGGTVQNLDVKASYIVWGKVRSRSEALAAKSSEEAPVTAGAVNRMGESE